MLCVTILRTEDFTDDLRPAVQELIIEMIEKRGAKLIQAGGDSKDMIYNLFRKLAIWYPEVSFSILLSNEKMAYGDDGLAEDNRIFCLDLDIIYEAPKNPARNRDRSLIKKTDVLICRKGSIYDDTRAIRKIADNYKVEIVAI